MRRHDLDWVSLIAGAVFVSLAVAYAAASITDRTLDNRVVWPLVLVALGIGGIVAAVRANAWEERAFVEAEAGADPTPDPVPAAASATTVIEETDSETRLP